MKVRILLASLLLTSTSTLAQAQIDEVSQYEITNNVVDERAYTLPDADNARNSNLLNEKGQVFFQNANNITSGTLSNDRLNRDLGNKIVDNARSAETASFAESANTANFAQSANTANFAANAAELGGNTASFYRNASNLNAGTLNNGRLNSDLGNRTIDNARNADFADEADGLITSGSVQIGQRGVFSIRGYNNRQVRHYDIPNGATTIMVEAVCRTTNNHSHDAAQKARVFLNFNQGFRDRLNICYSGRNAGDTDQQTSAVTLQFDIPNDASQITIVQELRGHDASSVTGGNIYWFGPSGSKQNGLDTGVATSTTGRYRKEERCSHKDSWKRAAHCYLDGIQVDTTATTLSSSSGGGSGGGSRGDIGRTETFQ